MTTCTFRSVVDLVAEKLKWEAYSADWLSAVELAKIAGAIGEVIDQAWRWAFWPDAMATEQRTVLTDATTGEFYVPKTAAAWDSGTTYGADAVAERYGLYYESQAAANLNHDPATDDGTWWVAVAQTPIGTLLIKGVTTNHPRASEYPYHWPFAPQGDRIIFTDPHTPETVWMQFRKTVPAFSGVEWDESIGTYAVGDVRFYKATGECYRCVRAPAAGVLPTDTDYWLKVDFPAVLKKGVACLAAASLASADETQAERLDGEGIRALADAADFEMGQQGQVHSATWES